jgi:cytochrome P450
VGTTVLMSQWVMHRDARYFDDPDSFRPERWLDGLAERLPAGAYLPSSAKPWPMQRRGPSPNEASLVIATIAQRFRLRVVPGHPVVPEPLVTLRPRHGIRMTLHARN